MPITSIISLNQIIDWFQNFQENHYFLKDFGFGEPYDIGTSRQMTFPYMWVTMNEDSNIATGSNVKSAIPDISFSVMFMDKINNQDNYLDTNGFPSDNSQEILSDTLQCLQDLITEIQQNWGQYGVLISQDVSFYPAIDETQDKATGVVGRFVLRTRQVNCVIPEAPSTIVVQPNQATYATLLTCETLVDCPIFRTYAYTGGTYISGTSQINLTSLNGNVISITGFTAGTSGSSGSSGQNGSSGTSGANGTSGSSGVSGSAGVSGSNGSSGSSGSSGESGISGSSGSSGSSGTNGSSGSSGSSGIGGLGLSAKAGIVNGTSGYTYDPSTGFYEYPIVFSQPFGSTAYTIGGFFNYDFSNPSIGSTPISFRNQTVSGFTMQVANSSPGFLTGTTIAEWSAIAHGETAVPGTSGTSGSSGSNGTSGSSGSSGIGGLGLSAKSGVVNGTSGYVFNAITGFYEYQLTFAQPFGSTAYTISVFALLNPTDPSTVGSSQYWTNQTPSGFTISVPSTATTQIVEWSAIAHGEVGLPGTSGVSGSSGSSGTSGVSGTAGTSGTSPATRSTINYATENTFELNAATYNYATWIIGNNTTTRTLNVTNLAVGQEVVCYIKNTNVGSKTFNFRYATATFEITNGIGALITSATLPQNNGLTIVVRNVNGTIVGSV